MRILRNLEADICPFCQEFSSKPGTCPVEEVNAAFVYGDRTIFFDGTWNVIPTIGAFVPGYTLLVNDTHYPSLYHCPARDKQTFANLMQLMEAAYKSVYQADVFMFEHGVVNTVVKSPTSVNHVHLHILPFKEAYETIGTTLLNQYDLQEYVFEDVQDITSVVDGNNIQSYLLYFARGRFHLFDIRRNDLPSQYLRKVIYAMEYPRDDDGWNWRNHVCLDNMLTTYWSLRPFFGDLTTADFSKRRAGYEQESVWIRNPEFITPLIPQPYGNQRFLDVACGTGVVCENAHRSGWNVTAVDSCQEMLDGVDHAISKVLACAECLPFADNAFEVVACRQGLQYMDKQKALGEMIRVSAHKLILLHATVNSADTAFWQAVFNRLGYVGKDIMESYEIQDIIRRFPTVTITGDKTLYSREQCVIPDGIMGEIAVLLRDNQAVCQKYNVVLDVATKTMHYDLEWHWIAVEQRGAYEAVR